MRQQWLGLTIGMIALFVALGGPATAARVITGAQVKDSSLTGKDVRNSSLTTSDVKNRSLLARDFKTGQLPRGATGATGAQGAQGPAGATKVTRRVGAVASCASTAGRCTATGTVSCEPGERAVGGGFDTDEPVVTSGVPYESQPTGDPPTGWEVKFTSLEEQMVFSTRSAHFRPVVVCAAP